MVAAPASHRCEFQSAPGGEAGGNAARRGAVRRFLRFQSAPGGEAGGNRLPRIATGRRDGFQSAPGGEAGGNPAAARDLTSVTMFQSAPGGEAGGNGLAGQRSWEVPRGFNPPPAVRPGETRSVSARGRCHEVSIRPRR